VQLVRKDVEEEFVAHVQQRLKYPLLIEEFSFEKATDLRGYCTDVSSLDELPKLLANAPYVALLAWLATDARAQNWKALSPNHGKLKYDPGGHYNVRHYAGGIASYVRWKLESTPWLPTRDGQPTRPRNCLIETVSAISDLLPTPTIPRSEDLQRYGMDRGYLFPAFDNAGVLPGFSHMGIEQLYDLLLSLPKVNPSGELAKSVYEAALHHLIDTEARESEARKRFVHDGKVFARKGTERGYCAVQQVWRLGAEDLPLALRDRLHVAELPKSVSAERVEALLGVKSIKPGQIVRRIHRAVPANDADAVENEIEQFLKPLIRRLRRTRAEKDRAKRAFERLRVMLCKAISGEIEFLGETVPIELGCWG
jgi:hypothetical protein